LNEKQNWMLRNDKESKRVRKSEKERKTKRQKWEKGQKAEKKIEVQKGKKRKKKERKKKTSDMLFLAIRAANQRREARQHFTTELHRSMPHLPLNTPKAF